MEESIFEKNNIRVGLAGPGTGKTTYFKKLSDSSQFKGKNILILSFINKLVEDLQEEFRNYENVKVSTLHSFANSLIKNGITNEYIDVVLSEDFLYIKSKECDYSIYLNPI